MTLICFKFAKICLRYTLIIWISRFLAYWIIGFGVGFWFGMSVGFWVWTLKRERERERERPHEEDGFCEIYLHISMRFGL